MGEKEPNKGSRVAARRERDVSNTDGNISPPPWITAGDRQNDATVWRRQLAAHETQPSVAEIEGRDERTQRRQADQPPPGDGRIDVHPCHRRSCAPEGR